MDHSLGVEEERGALGLSGGDGRVWDVGFIRRSWTILGRWVYQAEMDDFGALGLSGFPVRRSWTSLGRWVFLSH